MSQILLVEDASFFERVIRRHLDEIDGLEVISATSRADAEALLADPAFKPVIALVDLTLPDAPDGEIVDVTLAASLPTIVFSGRFDESLRETLLSKGIVDYILKDSPASLTYLTTLVRRVHANRGIDALVIDDSRTDTEVIARRLELYRLRVHTAASYGEAIAMLDTLDNLRLVVLDYIMPEADGFELLRALRSRYGMNELAVIGLSSRAGPDVIARFLKSGANDFLPKSCTPEEFMLRISQNLDMLDRIQTLSAMAHGDVLTGISNRRHLFSDGNTLFDRTRKAGEAITVAAIDIDRFKSVNDRHGHEQGDELIRQFGELLRTLSPPRAFPARLGGDEFCVLLPGLDAQASLEFVTRLREQLLERTGTSGPLGMLGPVTISAGLSAGTETTLHAALRTADMRLYAAKHGGRNRTVAS
ncbi:diguanylate cyclase [Stappia indica]|uniref:diguanylate cyclase n=1 Tax=Stappia indica TaxID=538381 RepID=UPI001CD560D7|nr:diguanylate cyclase [Stappia indica]MCA1297642.1 diguanylate cyclase [Stappia indica]